jgi:ribonuclease E
MAKKMLIDATHPEETRVVVVDGNKVEEFDFETINKRQLAGNIYLAKVTRVEPSLQAAFVDYGGNRHGFLAFAEIHPDYYQIPIADRKALLDEERALARADDDDEKEKEKESNGGNRRRGRSRGSRAESAKSTDAVKTSEINGMDVVDLSDEDGADTLFASGATEAVAETSDVAAAVDAAPDAASQSAVETQTAPEEPDTEAESEDDSTEDEGGKDKTYTAAEGEDEIESVADEDVSEEIRAPRRPRARRYKIQEVVKVRQILLVQVVKEERGNKGAALTTYLSLAGRYCVLMPNTARGGGISRKITQVNDRKKLKEIASEIKVPEGAGLIIRTAGAQRTKPEIRRDYEYLMRLWEQIRELTLKSVAPAAIYEEGDLIKRSIRDLYSREIDEVLVEGAEGYRIAKDFMRMIMPSHAKAVQPYNDPTPLFARFQVESYLGGMFNPTVQLKSGGYIVIGITEALVAIDVNSGRATKEGSIEDTATKTNLEAADEVARQLRLRDLAGLIVIDFIDMEDRRNNAAVEKRMKDKLKTDRARIQIGRISGFGLMEMSRQRLRPGMLESTTQPCAHCHGTGLIRSDDSMALQILRALEEEGTRKRSKEVLLKAPIAVVNFLMNQKREHIALIEARYGMSVRVEADPSLISPDYSLEKFKTATRVVHEVSSAISGNSAMMGAFVDDIEDPEIPTEEAENAIEEAVVVREDAARDDAAGDGTGRKKRRRRRRRRTGSGGAEGDDNGSDGDENGDDSSAEQGEETADAAHVVAAEANSDPDAEPAVEAPAKPKPRSRTRTRKPKEPVADVAAEPTTQAVAEPAVEAVAQAAAETPIEAVADEKPKKLRVRRPRVTKAAAAAAAAEAEAAAAVPAEEVKTEAAVAVTPEVPVEVPVEPAAVEPATPEAAPLAPVQDTSAAQEGAVVTADPVVEPEAAPSDALVEEKPRRRGWWNLGR